METMRATVELRELCVARSGDKGNKSNASLFAYCDDVYEIIREQVTADRVKEFYGDLVAGGVVRFEAPKVWGLNFVMDGALGGGAARSLRADNLGKTIALGLLRMTVEVPRALADARRLQRPALAELHGWCD